MQSSYHKDHRGCTISSRTPSTLLMPIPFSFESSIVECLLCMCVCVCGKSFFSLVYVQKLGTLEHYYRATNSSEYGLGIQWLLIDRFLNRVSRSYMPASSLIYLPIILYSSSLFFFFYYYSRAQNLQR